MSPSGTTSDLQSGSLPDGVARRLPRGPDPVDQAAVVGWLRARPLPGLVEVRSSLLVEDRVEVIEARFDGFSLGDALEVVHRHISTAVALGIVRDAALALARLHDLDRARPPVHGHLQLRELLVSREGEVRIGGLSGQRGDVRDDVRGLLSALRDLLRPKAEKPGGAALLERLSSLRFDSAHELHQTIAAHLEKQPKARLVAGRARFTSAVLAELGGPRSLPRAAAPSAATPVEPIPLHDTRPGAPPAPSSSEGPGRAATEPSARSYAAHALPEEAPEAAEEATVQSGGHEDLQAQLREELAASEGRAPAPRAPASSGSEPFFDPDSTEAILDPEGLDDPWGDSDEARSAQPTSILSVDLGELASAASGLERSAHADDDPFAPGSGLPEERSSLPASPSPRRVEPSSREGPRTGGAAADEGAVAAARSALLAPAAAREEREESAAVLVGNYRVVAAIGKGGMGEIYLARSTESSRLVALKVLGASESGDEEALGMLMDEAAIMARIEHPHVLKVVDFGRAHGRYYLATEYLEGRPLVRVMIESYDRDGGMDHTAVAWVGAQAARGLHAAHTATTSAGAPLEVVHRDVSPQNIFVTYGGRAKVIDFGVARATERFSTTQVGLVKGKAAYMSPEQAEGRPLDARSDVFSLGVCLWEMIAGQRLFKRALDYDTLVAVQTAPIEAPTIVRGRKDPELDQIILGALSRDPSARTPSAEALAEALERYARARGARDGENELHEMMERLFADEADRERSLVHQLEERSATEDEVVSLRELSGVSHSPGGKEITLVGEPDGLGALDRYGEARREVTGEQVIEKVRRLEAERRSGEHPAQSGFHVAASPPPLPPSASAPPSRPPRGRAWKLALALSILLAVLAALVLWSRTGNGAGPDGARSAAAPSRRVAEKVGRDVLVAALLAAGVKVTPRRGAVQRVEGIGETPLMLDRSTRVRRVATEGGRGWILELTPVDGGPAVVWLAEEDEGLTAKGLSVNDCPAQARVDEAGVEIRYGAGSTRVPHGARNLTDVAIDIPAGADRLELRPLGLALGREVAGSGLTRCPTGWGLDGQVHIQRLPAGRHELRWTGEHDPVRTSVEVAGETERAPASAAQRFSGE